ncbi:hypothetical protein ACFO5Q_16785 [Kordiimonas lipolytica]|uniref:Uncharacterized protein n=1 Tax=Kordiimonas lipolytica TaxID=1662421 RepID=A0ABV8UFM1_9PROT|nr:hypothetical protein [Kordiimonas lipolytica]
MFLFWIVFFLTYFAYDVYYWWQEGPGLEHYYYCQPNWFCD